MILAAVRGGPGEGGRAARRISRPDL